MRRGHQHGRLLRRRARSRVLDRMEAHTLIRQAPHEQQRRRHRSVVRKQRFILSRLCHTQVHRASAMRHTVVAPLGSVMPSPTPSLPTKGAARASQLGM